MSDESIRQMLAGLDFLSARVEREYREQRRVIAERRWAIQASCPHASTTYYPDPSGNNDSSTVCNVCGAEV